MKGKKRRNVPFQRRFLQLALFRLAFFLAGDSWRAVKGKTKSSPLERKKQRIFRRKCYFFPKVNMNHTVRLIKKHCMKLQVFFLRNFQNMLMST